MRILIVDDEPTILDIIADLLESEGFEIEKASSGNEAIDKFNANDFDLVITDIIMPGIEGIALIERLKDIKPKTHFIAMSGGGFAGPLFYLESAEAFGAEKTITKPIKPKELLELIEQFVK